MAILFFSFLTYTGCRAAEDSFPLAEVPCDLDLCCTNRLLGIAIAMQWYTRGGRTRKSGREGPSSVDSRDLTIRAILESPRMWTSKRVQPFVAIPEILSYEMRLFAATLRTLLRRDPMHVLSAISRVREGERECEGFSLSSSSRQGSHGSRWQQPYPKCALPQGQLAAALAKQAPESDSMFSAKASLHQ